MRKMYSGETIIQNRKQGGKIYETHQETALCRCIHACRMHPRSRAITADRIDSYKYHSKRKLEKSSESEKNRCLRGNGPHG